MSEINPVAWTNEGQMKRAKEDPGGNVIMWGEPLPYHNDIALCRHDEAMAEIERLRSENERLQRLFTHAGEQLEECRQQLDGTDENTLLRHLAYIRQKSGVGMKPMLSELADAIADRIAEARNNALDEAADAMEARSNQGWGPEASACYRNAAATIRALKDSAP